MGFFARGLLTGHDRYGYDGSWSAISLRVGTPPQWIDVMVDTVSSETWLVGPGGCPGNSEWECFFVLFCILEKARIRRSER